MEAGCNVQCFSRHGSSGPCHPQYRLLHPHPAPTGYTHHAPYSTQTPSTCTTKTTKYPGRWVGRYTIILLRIQYCKKLQSCPPYCTILYRPRYVAACGRGWTCLVGLASLIHSTWLQTRTRRHRHLEDCEHRTNLASQPARPAKLYMRTGKTTTRHRR